MALTPALVLGRASPGPPLSRRRAALGLHRSTALASLDLAAIIVSAFGVAVLLRAVAPNDGASPPFWIGLLLVAAWSTAHCLDVYDRLLRARPRHVARRVLICGSLSLVVCAGLPYLWWPVAVERWPMARDALIVIGALIIWRLVRSFLLAQSIFRIRAVVLTRGRAGRSVHALLRHGTATRYEIVGLVVCGQKGTDIAKQSGEVLQSVAWAGAELVIVDGPGRWDGWIQAVAIELKQRGVVVMSLADVYASLCGRVQLARRGPALTVPHAPQWDVYTWMQRIMDVLVATVGLALASPVLVTAALAIVVDSSGPPLYRQTRVGHFGRSFNLIKLRTMRADAEADGGAVWAAEADPRVTRVGRLLRRCHADELPQLWNVLRGDMSLVGPRPERPEFVGQLMARLPLYSARHAVRPGITGWAQVQFRYARSVRDASTKLQYDLYYVSHRHLVLDLIIVLKTVLVVLRFRDV
jgi:exopolysaccharide biosynthesis polyprenyl glycosylphosphotransferase